MKRNNLVYTLETVARVEHVVSTSTWGKTKEEEGGKEGKPTKEEGKGSLDDCLDEMEKFLSELDEPEAKKRKEKEEAKSDIQQLQIFWKGQENEGLRHYC